MAVLKDLIVHGASRFINIAQFNSLSADKISAEEGIFNKLIATNLSATEASITDLTATNAKVMGLLDVKGELHTNKWTNSNISNVGGSFYISPTVSTTIASGNTPMSITIGGTANDRSLQVTGGNFTTDAVKTYDNNTKQTSTVTWVIGSHVMVTGNVRLTSTGVDYPLGTLTGYLTAYLSQGGFTVGGIDSPALETIITELGTSNLKSYDISISMFEIGPRGSNTLKPVGIMMTSYGVDKSTYIDIYGGVNTKTTDSTTGFTVPNVRIGYLGGLPSYDDSWGVSRTPTGWGIYTDNGYFKGVIVADSGLVGKFTIADDLHSGDGIGMNDNVYVSPGTEAPEGITIAGSPEQLIWAFAAGQNFGVTTTGALYATGAHIDGDIIAQSLTIGSGANAYDGAAAINISGYTIEITIDSTGVIDAETTTYLYPHLYHNGIEVTTGIDYSHFIWYRNDDSIGTEGDANNQGRYLATYGDSYRVIYDFDDGAVGGGTEVQTRTVDPSKYITRINDTGISIHPEIWNNESSYIQLDGTGMELFNSSGVSIAQYGNVARVGINNSSRFLMNVDSLQAYNSNNQKYFEVSEDGLSWGNNTAATTTQVNAAAQTASSYIAYIDDINGIKVANSNPYNASNYVQITSNEISLVGGGVSKATITPAGMDLYINPNNRYNGTCNSSYYSYTKEVYINFFPSTLTVGTEVFITFVNGSTITSGSHDYDKVTLKINYGEKKEIRDVNNLDSLWNKTISKGSICHFIYNGTYWVYQGLASGSKIASFTGNGINLYKNNRLAGYIRLQEYSFGLYFDDDDIDLYNGYDYGINFRGYKIDPTVNNGFSAHGYVSVTTPNTTTPESNSDANLLLTARAYNTDTYISLYSNVTDTGRIVTFIEASQSISVASDERLKTNFKPISQLSDLILELNPIEYHWINKQTDTKHFGFKAQEVQKSLKKFNINNTNYALVGENTRGYLNIAYEELIPLMIDVIQKQEKRISKLEAQLEGGLN